MDYQKMWYVMKDRLMKEGERIGLQPDYRKAADDHLKLMSEIEIKAMAESQRVCECGGCCSDGEPEPPNRADRQSLIRKQQPTNTEIQRKSRKWFGHPEKDFW